MDPKPKYVHFFALDSLVYVESDNKDPDQKDIERAREKIRSLVRDEPFMVECTESTDNF